MHRSHPITFYSFSLALALLTTEVSCHVENLMLQSWGMELAKGEYNVCVAPSHNVRTPQRDTVTLLIQGSGVSEVPFNPVLNNLTYA